MVEHPKIPYSRVKTDGRRYFEPTPKMKALGFEARALGIDGPEARVEALRLRGLSQGAVDRHHLERESLSSRHRRLCLGAVPPHGRVDGQGASDAPKRLGLELAVHRADFR